MLKCLVGNSSSAIREGAYLGVPSVNVGTRQKGREHGENVQHCDHKRDAIVAAIQMQLRHGKYAGSTIFGEGCSGEQIAELLAHKQINIQKKLHY